MSELYMEFEEAFLGIKEKVGSTHRGKVKALTLLNALLVVNKKRKGLQFSEMREFLDEWLWK